MDQAYYKSCCDFYGGGQKGSGFPIYNKYQSGHGFDFPIYNRGQTGHGIFSTIGRFALPILKSLGTMAAPHLLGAGGDILSDVVSGKSIKASVKGGISKHGKALGREVLDNAPELLNTILAGRKRQATPKRKGRKNRRVQRVGRRRLTTRVNPLF